jgi:hypothetical protein
MIDGTVLAEVTDPASLHHALRQRAEMLQISRETLDAVAGVPSGYCGKLLSLSPQKSLGAVSMPAVLGALGVRLVLLTDPTAAPLLARLPKRERPLTGTHWRTQRRASEAATALGAAGAALNKARNQKLTAAERVASARNAATARWSRRRRKSKPR